jgi:hypothetical protein
MLRKLLLTAFVVMGLSSFAFAETSQCTVEEVTSSALALGNSVYKKEAFDGIKIEKVEQSRMGVHFIESYDLWLTSQGVLKNQIRIVFVVRPVGNLFYGKEGCGVISASIPFFQAP